METLRTGPDRIRWAVDFARRDLDRYREGDWLNLRDELAAWLRVTGDLRDLAVMPMKSARALSEKTVRDLQAATQSVLAGVVAAYEHFTNKKRGDGMPLPSIALSDGQSWTAAGHPDGVTLIVETSTHDGFMLKLLFLLMQQGTGNVRRCPECGGIFWRVKRQLYCSRSCSTRVNMRAYVERKQGRKPRRRGADGRIV